jgi:hypothetical protein
MIDTVDVAATTATTTATATATTATATAAATATRAITPAVNVAAASATVIFVRAEGPRGFGVGGCRSTGGASPPDGVVCPVLVIRCSLLDVSGARLAGVAPRSDGEETSISTASEPIDGVRPRSSRIFPTTLGGADRSHR